MSSHSQSHHFLIGENDDFGNVKFDLACRRSILVKTNVASMSHPSVLFCNLLVSIIISGVPEVLLESQPVL